MLSSDIKSIQHIVSYEFVISPKSRGLDRDIVCRDGTVTTPNKPNMSGRTYTFVYILM